MRRIIAASASMVLFSMMVPAAGAQSPAQAELREGLTRTVYVTVTDKNNIPVTDLGSGDFVEGLMITNILFGCHPRNVDGYNRLAFVAEFLKEAAGTPDDPNNVLIALPVPIDDET